jgi:hypothetical protein
MEKVKADEETREALLIEVLGNRQDRGYPSKMEQPGTEKS